MGNCKLFHGIHAGVIVIFNILYTCAVIKDLEPVADQASRITSDGSCGIVGIILGKKHLGTQCGAIIIVTSWKTGGPQPANIYEPPISGFGGIATCQPCYFWAAVDMNLCWSIPM